MSTDFNQYGEVNVGGKIRTVNESAESKKASSLQAVAIAIPVVSLALGALSVFIVWRLNLIPYGPLMFKVLYMAMIMLMWPIYWLVMGLKWMVFGYKPVVRSTLVM
jgi:hypothetical protein